MQHQHVDTDLHVQQCSVDMLRVVFESKCDEELRVGVGVVYECSICISISESECRTVNLAVIAAIAFAKRTSVSGAVCATEHLTVDRAVPGQHNVRSVSGYGSE